MTVFQSPNLGHASGEAIIDGNIATFKPADTKRCEITLVFFTRQAEVVQEGSDADCGFGHNVYATGTYGKIRSGKPSRIAALENLEVQIDEREHSFFCVRRHVRSPRQAQEAVLITPHGAQPLSQLITADQVSGVYRDGASELRYSL